MKSPDVMKNMPKICVPLDPATLVHNNVKCHQKSLLSDRLFTSELSKEEWNNGPVSFCSSTFTIDFHHTQRPFCVKGAVSSRLGGGK